MSTRSSTVILGSGGPWHLYRHCDGYPAEAGAAIVEACRNARTEGDVIRTLLAVRYDATPYQPERPVYEPDYARADDIGDLEHVYIVELLHYHGMPRSWRIKHFERPNFDTAAQPYREWPCWSGSLPEFTERVNQNRRDCNARCAQLRNRGQNFPGIEDDYPMLPVPFERPTDPVRA